MKKLFLLVVLLISSGCASLSPSVNLTDDPQQMALFQTRMSELVNQQQWEIRSRFSVTSKDESYNGHMSWQQAMQAFDIQLNGPFGAGSVRLYGDDLMARIEVSEDKYFIDTDVENLLHNHLGIKLPLKSLRYWMMGMAIPERPLQGGSLDEQGLLSSLRQLGWSIDFKRYAQYQGHWLPNKIFLENEEYVIKLIISDWKLQHDKSA